MPKFSVVVPTRDRPDVLPQCLSSLDAQRFDDVEFIVFDNGDEASAAQIADDFRKEDPRFRYFRAPRPLCLRDSWEWAVTAADGQYVTVLGDDDALLPWALAEADRLTKDLPGALVAWKRVFYCYPDCATECDRNYLFVPLVRQLFQVDGRRAVREVANWQTSWDVLPGDYYSFVPRHLLDRVHAANHKLYRSRYADVYAGFRNAYLAGSFIYSLLPFSVAGVSRHSTGVALVSGKESRPLDDWRKTHDGDATHHPLVPDLPLPTVAVAEAFNQARDAYFPNDRELTFDRLKAAMRHAAEVPAAPWRRAALDLVLDTLTAPDPAQADADFKALHVQEIAAFDRFVRNVPPGREPRLSPGRAGYTGDALILDGSRFGLTDAYGAAKFVADLLGYAGALWDYDIHQRS